MAVAKLIPTWQSLRGIGSSRFARLTLIMPAVGYMIIFNAELSTLFLASTKLLGLNKDNVEKFSNVNLYFLYFGLLLFGVASAAYYVVCPGFIKQFANEYEYYTREIEVISRARLSELRGNLQSRFGYTASRDLELPHEAAGRIAEASNKNSREFWIRQNSDLVMEILQVNYQRYNESKPAIRLLIFCGYCAAIVLITIPTLITCYKIVSSL